MKILCITHADFESPGVIVDWVNQRACTLEVARPYLGEVLPTISAYDSLILMGGPQSLSEIYPDSYLAKEIKLIQEAILLKKTILGICLGAQLIGEAFGAKTERSPNKEIGVYPITLSQEAQVDPLLKELPHALDVIHWHGDMPGLTEESVILAYSEGCPRQIIRYGQHIYGFQCHLEINRVGIEALIKAVPEDLKPGPFIQSEGLLLQQNYQPINELMFDILDRLMGMHQS